jgi:serine/threonine protein kinase
VTQDAFVGQQVARYRITRLLGKGGMGRVYLAVHPEIGSRVAIKVLSDEWADAPDVLERFFAEARTVNLISHDNIIKVLDLDRTPAGRPYIVMEFVEGKTLREVIALGGSPLGGVAHVMTEVLLALEAAHRAGVVHRDLKPDNVMVTASGHAKVLDFGIAKLATDRSLRTRTGAAVGTPPYMAPEQILGEPIDGRTDLYAAGVMLYELATGKRPFDGATDFQIMQAHLNIAPPAPRSLRAELPEALEAVILQALAKRPADRFHSARAMAHAIRVASASVPADQWQHLSSIWVADAPSASYDQLPAVTSEPTVPDAKPTTPGRLVPAPQGRLDQKTRSLTPPAREPRAVDEPKAIAPMRPSTPVSSRRRVVLGIAALVALVAILAMVWNSRRDSPEAVLDATSVTLIADASGALDAPVDLPPTAPDPIDAATASLPDATATVARRDAAIARPDAQIAVAGPRDAAVVAAHPSGLGNPPIKDEPTIPPRRSQDFAPIPMPATDLAKFDPAAWAPIAQKYARMLEPDAVLTELDAGVRDDGTAFVGQSNVRLNFRSEAARKANDPMRLPCIVVRPSSRGIGLTRYDHCDLKKPLVTLPRCGFRAVFPQRVSKHADAGSIHLLYNSGGWRVTQYREKADAGQTVVERKMIADDC